MKYIFALIDLAYNCLRFLQNVPPLDSAEIYNTKTIEVKPEFPGGLSEFYNFIAANFKTPNVAGLYGKIYLSFVNEKDGSVADFKVLRDIGYGTGQEAIRVLEMSPKWKPGSHNDIPVRVQYQLPINIGAN